MNGDKLIKVCGMTEGENIRQVEELGVDLIGFIFFPQSPRCTKERPGYLPQKSGRVGVFVNESLGKIKEKTEEYGLDYIQLHGNESPAVCDALHRTGIKVIKALSVETEEDIKAAAPYIGHCDLFLFDTKCKQYGGSGKPFDWNILDHYKAPTPFLLSGGIHLDCISALKNFKHAQLIGYDINSRFEVSPGIKDINTINQFLNKI